MFFYNIISFSFFREGKTYFWTFLIYKYDYRYFCICKVYNISFYLVLWLCSIWLLPVRTRTEYLIVSCRVRILILQFRVFLFVQSYAHSEHLSTPLSWLPVVCYILPPPEILPDGGANSGVQRNLLLFSRSIFFIVFAIYILYQ